MPATVHGQSWNMRLPLFPNDFATSRLVHYLDAAAAAFRNYMLDSRINPRGLLLYCISSDAGRSVFYPGTRLQQ